MDMNQNIFEIIAAKINGEVLTDKERQTLDNWLAESLKNMQIFEELKDIYSNKEDIYSFKGIDANNAWQNHLRRVNSTNKLNIRFLLKYAAIILPIVITLSIFFNVGKLNVFSGEDYCKVIVPKGQIQELVLADGTKIWLNSDSELKYPNEFRGDTREVYLKGEAYFSVTKNKQKPFIVNTDLMDIKVLGTEFNLSCYETNKNIEATLYEGKIAYKTRDFEGVLKPGFKAVLNKENNKVEIRKINISQAKLWKEGIYVFDGIKIEDLSHKISRWYNIEVFIESDSVRKMEFTGAMERDKPVDYFIELLEETNSVECKIKDGVLYIDEIP